MVLAFATFAHMQRDALEAVSDAPSQECEIRVVEGHLKDCLRLTLFDQ